MISNGLLALPHREPGAWGVLLSHSFVIQWTSTESTLVPGTGIRKAGVGVDSHTLEDERQVHRGMLAAEALVFFPLRFS